MPKKQGLINAIRYQRLRAGLKQYEMAQLLGMHPTRLSKLEISYCEPTQAELEKIAELLKVEVDLLTQPKELFQ